MNVVILSDFMLAVHCLGWQMAPVGFVLVLYVYTGRINNVVFIVLQLSEGLSYRI